MQKSFVKEADIEMQLKKRIEKIPCVGSAKPKCLKFVSPGVSGVPDRILLLPGGETVFVELKAPGKKERPLQLNIQRKLRKLGFTVFSSVDSVEKVESVVMYCENRMRATQGEEEIR